MFVDRSVPIKISNKDDLVFQAIAWHAQDVDFTDIDGEEDRLKDYSKYVIKCFGSTHDGKTVSVSIKDFKPYFFIKIDDCWSVRHAQHIGDFLVKHLPRRMQETSIAEIKPVNKKDFWGFTNFKTFKFLRIKFNNIRAMRICAKILNESVIIPTISAKPLKLKVYESNIDPYIRFMHSKNIEPSKWIRLPAGSYSSCQEILPTNCQIDVECTWKKAQYYACDDTAPFLIASFDIECSSLTGDFPMPKKNYKKLASDLYELYSNILKNESEYKRLEAVKAAIHYAFDVPYPENPDVKQEWLNNYIHRVDPKTKPRPSAIRTVASAMADDIYSVLIGKTIPHGEQITREKIVCELTAKFSRQQDSLPELKGDEVIQVGTTFHRYGDKECSFRHILTLGTCDPIDGVTVETCESEEELLQKWKELIVKTNPDIITGYNIFGFDMLYMYERSLETMTSSSFMKIGRFKSHESKFKEAKLSSSALGDNLLRYIDMEGRVLIDLMKVIQRDHKLDSYKLDNVASHFMKMNKHDVSPNDIFRLQRGTSADRRIIADYCVQDCALCNHLMMKLEIVANNMGMANVCLVPLSFIFMRGQGIKIFSLVLKQCSDEDFLIPVVRPPIKLDTEEEEEDSYEGAIVLEPKEGIYIDDPVSVLDYASLYPSSMISENLSHDCIVIDPKYDNLPGVEYLDITYDVYEGAGDAKKKVGERVCRYMQPPNGEKGIIPRILMKLLKARKTTRKKVELSLIKMKDGKEYKGFYDSERYAVTCFETGMQTDLTSTDIESVNDLYNEFQKAVLDGLQNAYKVTANSLYGQIGAKTSPIYLKDIAACTTATGRKMILMAKDFLEKNYDANIIYGDSVAEYTPVTVRINNKIVITSIKNLAKRYGNDNWLPCLEQGKQTKEACELVGVDAWTDNGWTTLHRVIRHKLADHKTMIRVNTHTGVVDVTDDHSLLKANKEIISPRDINIRDALLHRDLPLLESIECTFTTGTARIMGMFMANGSCGSCDCSSGHKNSWAITNADMKLLQMYKSLCEKEYPTLNWVIMPTLESSGVHKLVPHGDVERMVLEYGSIMYEDEQKIVPTSILNADESIKTAFWQGLNGYNKKCGNVRIDQKSQVSAATIFMLASSIGYNVSINTCIAKQNIYRINCRLKQQIKNPDAVKKSYGIQYAGYVYDLTTANHHFSAGIGRLIVHNTDSIFCIFPNTVLEAEVDVPHDAVQALKGKAKIMPSIKTAIKASNEFKQFIKPPHDAEYEKTFWPFILLSKKRYVGNLYEMDDKKYKQKSMGIVLKRRDNAPIVKTVYGGIIDIILEKQDVGKSIEFLKTSLNDLVNGKCGLEELVITKSLRAEYKDPTRIAHKVLAERMGERDPGNKPQVNDRIPFVYIQEPASKYKNKNVKTLQGDRIEHPDFIRQHKLKPDYTHYITNQIMKPVLQVYGIIAQQIPGNRNKKEFYEELYKKLEKEHQGNIRKIKDKYFSLRENDAQKLLFDPILIKLSNQKSGLREITSFFSPK